MNTHAHNSVVLCCVALHECEQVLSPCWLVMTSEAGLRVIFIMLIGTYMHRVWSSIGLLSGETI